ncbi:MAG: hypothetical protein ACX93U_24500 [Salipiger thiooxidans]|uniref:hypothetical protein n=1 Tax=Salipiger thiooxidans TaxID=282683 RepID=UPI001CFA224C|nr:hypothetical protein [Salipiger thiooxidans]
MSDHLKLVVSNGSCAEADPVPAFMSRSKALDRYRMQVIAAEIWSDWLRGAFRRPEDVAGFFEVRNSTAWNWWNGTTRPTADKVMIATLECPGFLDHLAAVVATDAKRAA